MTFIIKCIVKGYHACNFSVEDGEAFVAQRKRGERENTLKVVNQRGNIESNQIKNDRQ